MMEQEINTQSLFDVFASQQETYDEAQRKNTEESRKKTSYLRFSKDGKYTVRILPLAPVLDKDGHVMPMERKGYEYPLRSLMLKIDNPSDENQGKKGAKNKTQYVTVCNVLQAFPHSELKEDLIDAYVRVACEKYAKDDKLVKQITSGSFYNGLKWSRTRCMYVYDNDDRGKGIQLLQLSFSQYRDLEERKLNIWNKLLKKNPKAMCPISSIQDAWPVEITRKTEDKTQYTFNIDTLADASSLTEDELTELFNAPRIPEVIYRYTRYHLEATIAFLKQYDEKHGIDVMSSEEVKDCIEQIKMLLPSDDTSHFTIGGGDGDEASTSDDPRDVLDALWDRWDKMDAEGIDDKTDEGAELRSDIREFIEDNNIDVRVTRMKSNQDLLKEIDTFYDEEDDNDAEPTEDTPKDDIPHTNDKDSSDDAPQAPDSYDRDPDDAPEAADDYAPEADDEDEARNADRARESMRSARRDRREARSARRR